VPSINSRGKIGVYVDVANVNRNGGYGMHYDVLREFACRDEYEAIRLNAYASFDPERNREDINYRKGINAYFSVLREYGFKVIQKNVKWYEDDKGNRFGKANSDLDMAVDALMQSRHLDRVLLVTGDGDFVQVVRALQNYGCRVEIIGFDNVSQDLKREADMFVSGYLIPNLLPVKRQDHEEWGKIGSYARGYCYHYDEEKGFGFIRYMEAIGPGLWITDSRNHGSPYRSIFFHTSQLPRDFNTNVLPSREITFEFKLDRPRTGGNRVPVAGNLRLVSAQIASNPFYRKDYQRDDTTEDGDNAPFDEYAPPDVEMLEYATQAPPKGELSPMEEAESAGHTSSASVDEAAQEAASNLMP